LITTNREQRHEAIPHQSSGPERPTLRFVELFAGIGLVRLALERSGWRCLLANDIDPKKREMYVANFPDSDFHLADVWSLEAAALPRPIELITASFPCIDLSLAGNRSGLAGKHSGTFWALIRLLEGLEKSKNQSPVVLIENVVGFLTSHGGKDFVEAVRALNRCGYVVDAVVLDAKYFTAQSRPRLFLIGLLDEIAKPHTIQPNAAGILSHWNTILDADDSPLRPEALRAVPKYHPDLRWGFLNFPEPPTIRQKLPDIIEALSEESDRWWKTDQVEKLLSQMPTSHLADLRALAQEMKPQYGTVYRRKRPGGTRAELRIDGLAGCLRTPRGGSSKQIVVRAWRDTIRARWMTPREYGRLQGVPDTYKLPSNDINAYFGFGDAICVPAVQWLAESVLNPILLNNASLHDHH
jgi:DNA (cytosine-5)-methyltransferase 1